MANLSQKNGVYLARFRHLGREYKKSLKTTDRKSAEGAMHRVEDALHRLAVNLISVPPGVDAGDFIVSGGTSKAPQSALVPRVVPAVVAATREYLGNLEHLAESNRYTVRIHLSNLMKYLGEKSDGPLDSIQKKDLHGFVQARLRERAKTTVSKERFTAIQFFAWAVAMGYLAESPAADLTPVKSSGDPPEFRTYSQIEMIVARGGMSLREVLAFWDRLFLSPGEIGDLLALVRQRSVDDISSILHALAAYTGMRRGEVMRLQWTDVEFEEDAIVARSLKQSRQAAETRRRIEMHSELKTILSDWRKRRPAGQFVVCDQGSLRALTRRETIRCFVQPLRGTRWCLDGKKDWFKLGFHTYRHSFASNLAAAGVDQRVIDTFMGHQSEAMRKRYRHLFPRTRRSAIESFSLSSGDRAAVEE